MRGQRGRRNINRSMNTRRSINMLKSALHGHQNRLRHLVPPPVNRRPFNTMTIDHVFENTATPKVIEEYGPPDIFNFWLNQQGLVTIFNGLTETLQNEFRSRFTFRLRRIDAYAVPIGGSTQRPSVFLDVASLIPTVSDDTLPTAPVSVAYPLLKRIEDVGNLSECAKVSYTFPLHMADTPLNPIADFNFAAVSSNTENVSMRFHIQWTLSDTSVPVPAAQSSVESA